jgi:hypothetical protein
VEEEQQGLKVPKVVEELQEHQVVEVIQEHQGYQDLKGLQEQQELKELKVQQDPQHLRVSYNMVPLVTLITNAVFVVLDLRHFTNKPHFIVRVTNTELTQIVQVILVIGMDFGPWIVTSLNFLILLVEMLIVFGLVLIILMLV